MGIFKSKKLNLLVEKFIETGEIEFSEEEGISFDELEKQNVEKKIIEDIADDFFVKKESVEYISNKLNLNRKIIFKYLTKDSIIKDYLGVDGKTYKSINELRKIFYKDTECIEWDENKKMYSYPSFPTTEEIETLLKNVRRDRKYSALYNNYPCLFKRNKRNKNTLNKIDLIMSLDGYTKNEIRKYKKYIDSISFSSGYGGKEDVPITTQETEIDSYENRLTNLSCFEKPINKGRESMIHNLQQVQYKLGDTIVNHAQKKYKRKNFSDKQSEFIINNIIDYISNTEQIIKYDIIASKIIKDVNEKVVIPKNSKIEVKDISKQSSYLAEFLASPLKQDLISSDDEKKYYNKIITNIYEYFYSEEGQELREKIIDLIIDDLEGMIIANNIYIPNKNGNIDFYLSYKGRNDPNDHLRLTIRYKINMENWQSFYRIGNGEWLLNNGKKSNKCVLYPLKEKEFLTIKSVSNDYITFEEVLSENVNKYIHNLFG